MLKHWKLKNGFHVLLSPVHDTKSITVLVLIRVGSRYETPHLNGVSHFVEHLVFKGTKKRPSTLHISQELDRLGASYNAFTTKDHTGFYVKVSSRYTEIAMDIVSDIVQNAQFPSAEVERERTVIHEEINMYEDNPLMHVTDMLDYALYDKTSYLGQNIAGPKSVISDVSREDILKFWNTYYRPGNMALVLAGHITEDSAHQLVKKYFTGNGVTKKRAQFPEDKKYPAGPSVVTHLRDTGQVQVALGFHAFPYEHPLLPALHLLNVVLGSSMSSRLFVEIREKLGLCYMIRSSLNIYEQQGNLMIQSGVDRKRFPLAMERIVDELQKIKTGGVTQKELDDAKTFLKGKMDLSFEDSEEIASWYGAQDILLEHVVEPEQRIQEINAVTTKDVLKVAKMVFVPKNAGVAVIGPKSVMDARKLKSYIRALSLS